MQRTIWNKLRKKQRKYLSQKKSIQTRDKRQG